MLPSASAPIFPTPALDELSLHGTDRSSQLFRVLFLPAMFPLLLSRRVTDSWLGLKEDSDIP